jgi:hypothetical protein
MSMCRSKHINNIARRKSNARMHIMLHAIAYFGAVSRALYSSASAVSAVLVCTRSFNLSVFYNISDKPVILNLSLANLPFESKRSNIIIIVSLVQQKLVRERGWWL